MAAPKGNANAKRFDGPTAKFLVVLPLADKAQADNAAQRRDLTLSEFTRRAIAEKVRRTK
jgi:hypothetical protein